MDSMTTTEQTFAPPHLSLSQAPDGTQFRDLNDNGVMEPYENPNLAAGERADDLLGRLSVEEKVGLLFQTVIETGTDGTLLETPGLISKSPTSTVVAQKLMNHFNVHKLGSARDAARWYNALQHAAAGTPHGIPVTVSTDPRHAFVENVGVSFSSGSFSAWPEPLGLAAIGSADVVERFADIARQEYRAVGIRSALHPTVDLATEPRWARQLGTFGQDAQLASELVRAYLRGFQGEALSSESVACTTKHFPGGGPQRDGEDAHFPYGREQDYSTGELGHHLEPFVAAIESGTSGIMPYYGMPVGLTLDGEPVEEVGFGYNRQIITGLLRETLGYTGVILSDWELVNDNHVGDQVLPARAWGVEHLTPSERMVKILNAGVDQFGGEECTDLLLELVHNGDVTEDRLDESARRLLLVKFELGLFDNPFVDEDAADAIVGSEHFRAEGLRAQARSVTVLHATGALPLHPSGRRPRVYAEGVAPGDVGQFGEAVDDPADADVAIIRLSAPWTPRDDLFLEAWFHAGSLEFPPGLVHRLRRLSETLPLIIDVNLDRPAVLGPLADIATVLVATFGVSDAALADALTGRVPAEGKLPFAVPLSMEAVRASPPDQPLRPEATLYPHGHGVPLT
jgi:beta-glucosidase-like glycosyl hydrolase